MRRPRATPGDVKAQPVRVADVVFIGPLMMWGGARATAEQPLWGTALLWLGMTTISYNAVNHQRVRRRMLRRR